MIRIAYVIPTFDQSGAEKQLTLLAARLPREEFEPHVIALTRGGPYESMLRDAGIPVTILNKRLRFDPGAWWRMRRTLKSLAPDIVHPWLFAANSYARLAVSGGRRGRDGSNGRRPRVVVSERCVDSWKSGWQLALDRRLVRRTDWLVANSRAVAEFYQQRGYPAGRTTVIPNAVEVPLPPQITREDLLRQLGLPPDAKLVAYAGRLAKQKRLDHLLWSAQVLRQADQRARFLIIGDGPERDRLIHYARQVEVSEFTRFLGHRPDAASLLHLVDVFWLGSEFEGMSNSLMEALACGRPAVATNIPPNREVVTHGVEGFLVDVGDSTAFAQYTVKLFQDENLADRMGTAARERMSRDFSIDRMVEAHADLYRRLVATG